MSIGEPTMPTAEEQAKIEKERTISDAELLKGGAEYVVDENGEKRLKITEKQSETLEFTKDAELAGFLNETSHLESETRKSFKSIVKEILLALENGETEHWFDNSYGEPSVRFACQHFVTLKGEYPRSLLVQLAQILGSGIKISRSLTGDRDCSLRDYDNFSGI